MSTTTTQFDPGPFLTSFEDIATLALRCPVRTYEAMTLTVTGRSYGHADVADVIAGTAAPIEVRLSHDGRMWHSLWHNGPETGEWVYVERWTAAGREFHGFVDSVSRRILQSG